MMMASTSNKRQKEMENAKYIVVGGGIAGVSCAEQLAAHDSQSKILIISASRSLKGIRNYVRVTSKLEEFEVVEQPLDFMQQDHDNIRAIQARVDHIDSENRKLYTSDGQVFGFEKLCLASGGSPKLLFHHPSVLGIRDTETVEELRRRLADAKHVVVVGNGAIALETVHSIKDVEVTWIMKEDYMGSTFFDASADGFFRSVLSSQEKTIAGHGNESSGTEASVVSSSGRETDVYGNALGPNWMKLLNERSSDDRINWNYSRSNLYFETNSWPEMIRAHGPARTGVLQDGEWHEFRQLRTARGTNVDGSLFTEADPQYASGSKLELQLSSGRKISCDLIVSATGVHPNVSMAMTAPAPTNVQDDFAPSNDGVFMLGKDGGLRVNSKMQTTGSSHIFAAGDCASVRWPPSKLWFQMRLWSQARLQGMYVADCINLGDEGIESELFTAAYNFELFTHITTFLGLKVVLLGLYNGQGLGEHYEEAIKNCKVSRTDNKIEGEGNIEHSANDINHGNQLIDGGKLASEAMQTGNIKILYRVSPPDTTNNFEGEYIKLVLLNGRVVGAILVGETELEETCENLILNGVNVQALDIDILNPEVDIEDYFD
eukprot:gb/GECG01003269.1/.p1 GENE.gb/GECG01003269.1/~~gb/GECG01003269.1/.p1  ORF type:complete len:603 (+),score=86.45 gb/GECG01003269.1/:1-1809(+)